MEYLDIGAERPTQPPEPDISERDLDALRARIREEVEQEAEGGGLWGDMMRSGDINARIDICVALSMAWDRRDPDRIRARLYRVIARECIRREREELGGRDE